jgi:hypothetical protein
MARRGWAATDLARESGVSRPTISAALTGTAIAAKSVGLMARAFARVPAQPIIDVLLLGERDGIE